jgi:NAD(P)-dependent dehydrogenase (short-subunit alcohol dehydrogenase family)
MPLPIEGSVAFVTGGNRGLGRALVDDLLARGAAKVYATSRSPHTHDDPRVVPVVLDVTDPASVAAAAAQADDVTLLINNAGVSNGTPVVDGPIDGIRADLETNLFGLLHVSRAFAPILGAREQSGVLNVLSVLSWTALFGGGYAVSKAAALLATDALRLELAAQGTTVTALHVGFMDTDMAAGVDAPKVDPKDVARDALDAVQAGELEVLADDVSRLVKSQLAAPTAERYPQLATA